MSQCLCLTIARCSVCAVAFMGSHGAAQQPRVQIVEDRLSAGRVRIVNGRNEAVYFAIDGPQGGLWKYDQQSLRQVHHAPVYDVAVAHDESLWLTSGRRVLRLARDSDAHAVDYSPLFSSEEPAGTLFVTRSGHVMVENCARTGDDLGRFSAMPLLPDAYNAVGHFVEDPFGNLWALARLKEQPSWRQVVALTDAQPHQWQALAERTKHPADQWHSLQVDGVGRVWIAGPTGVLRFDPRRPDDGWILLKVPELPQVRPTALSISPDERILIGYATGQLIQVKVTTEGRTSVEVLYEPRYDEQDQESAVRAVHSDLQGAIWLVSGNRLLRIPPSQTAWQHEWLEMARLPAGIHDNIFTRVGTKLYTAGGKTYFGFPATEWRNLDNLWSYDIVRRRWQVESAMLEPGKAYSGIATLGDEVWLLGGHFRDGNDLIPTDTVEIYNPIAQTLRHGPRLPSPRTQCVALALDQRIYAIGGAGPGRDFLANMYSIDTEQSSWREEPAPPGPIAQASGCVLDGKLYVAAGSLVKCPGLYVYDPVVRQWDSIDHPPPDAPGAPLTAALDGEVWVMGGAGTDEGRATFIYRPQAGIWRRGPELPAPLSWGAAAAIEGRIFIAGGAFLSPDHPLHVNSDRSFLLRTQGHE